jgi:hypothetical protein
VAEVEQARDKRDYSEDQWKRVFDWLAENGFDLDADHIDQDAFEAAMLSLCAQSQPEKVKIGGSRGKRAPSKVEALANELKAVYPSGRPAAMKVSEIRRALERRPGVGIFGDTTLKKAIRRAFKSPE